MLLFIFLDCLFSWTICAWLFFVACFSLVCFGCIVCCGFGGLIRLVDSMDFLFYSSFFDIWFLSTVFNVEYFGFLFISVVGVVFVGCVLECYFSMYYSYFLLVCFNFLFCCSFCLLLTTDFILFFLTFELCGWSLCLLIASVSFYVRRGFAFSYMLFFMMVGTVLFLFGLSILIDKFGVFIFVGLGIFVCDSYLLTVVCSVFFLFALIKLPSFPFYGWLPEAHVESSSFGSMILAGVLLKFSAIFIVRFGCVLDINFLFLFVLDFLLLFVIGLAISCCIIVIQIDCKKIIAFLSVIHVNFSILALMNMNCFSIWIFVLLSLSHGFISSLLFFLIGVIYSVLASRVFKFINFLFFITPLFSFLFICSILANVGFPLFFSFVGECGVIFFVFNVSEVLCYCIAFFLFYCFITSVMFFVRLILFGSYTIKLFMSDVTVLVAICVEVILILFVFLTIIW